MLRRIFLLNHFPRNDRTRLPVVSDVDRSASATCCNRAGENRAVRAGITDIIRSTVMNEERTLNIYLPPGYNEQDSVRYPVIYLLDGSVDEDFIHMAGLVYFLGFLAQPVSAINRCGDRQRRPQARLHLPDDRRKRQEGFPDHRRLGSLIRYLGEEVIPHIRSRYKTNNTSTLIGQSFGGLLATEVLFTHPDWFSKYLIVSPSLWWDNQSLLNRTVTLATQPDVRIAVGKEGTCDGTRRESALP